MQRFKYVFLFCSCLVALALLTVQSGGADAATQKQNPHKTPPPTPAATSTTAISTLFGIAGLSSDNIWTVGTSMNIPQFTGQPLIEHWNGSKWLIVPSPTSSQNNLNTLLSVTTITNTDVWAAGFSMNPAKNASQPLIEHWNGANWLIVPSPNTIISGSLAAITASGPDDVWAVGSSYSTSGTSTQALILHWNGATWQTVPAASMTDNNSSLLAVTAINAHDAWAVGSSFSTKTSKALTEHWDGNTWQAIPTPPSNLNFNSLSGVTATSDHDIWTVGNSFSQPLQAHPSINHWDGYKWHAMPTSGLPIAFTPTAISATSTDNIWTVGNQTLAHWNGKSWQSFSVSSQKGFSSFSGILALSRNIVWAVGFNNKTKNSVPLIEHWNSPTWQVVTSPVPAN